MGHRLQSRIFWPVIAVICFLIAGGWISFYITSEQYAVHAAKRVASQLIRVVEDGQRELYPQDSATRSPAEEKALSKELLKYVKARIKRKTGAGKLLVFNSSLKQTYPSTADDGSVPERLREPCRRLLSGRGEESYFEEQLDIEGEQWYVAVRSIEAGCNIRAKYFVAAAPLPNLSLMWDYMGKLLAMIVLAAVCLAALLVWLVSKSISLPLMNFCAQVRKISQGQKAQITERYSLTELEILKEAYNQMETELRRSREAKDRFFQNASHDLRTPLASIIGYAQGIQCGVMKQPQEAAEIILSESMRMKTLVESILTLTKIDCQDLKLNPADMDLAAFLEERLEALRGMAGKCELRLEAPSGNLTIRTDAGLLGRILQNILANSIQYAKKTVTVSLEAEGNWAVICVRDDGKGFREEDLPHVFERFYQGAEGSFGIGLSVVWAGVQYLGGTIQAGNQAPPLKGAYYRLRLPLLLAEKHP